MKRLIAPALPVALLLLATPACAQNMAPAGTPQEGLGRAVSLNIGLSANEATWHVRAALNVAALVCREDAAMADDYNRMIEAESRPLAAADAGVKAQYRARYGADWEPMHDRDMTRLYNYFAQPGAHAGLCAAARDILVQGEGLSPIEFADFAAWALPRLDAPFSQAWRQVAVAQAAPVAMASAIPPPSNAAFP